MWARTSQRAPYFFTDRLDLGRRRPRAEEHTDSVVIRGDLAENKGIVLWHDARRVLAAVHVNEWDATDDLRALLGAWPGSRTPSVWLLRPRRAERQPTRRTR